VTLALTLRRENTGQYWRVWPDPEPIPPGLIHETGSYLFELTDCPTAAEADLLLDDLPLEALRAPAGAARWRWMPGFHAGEAQLELRLPGEPRRRVQVTTDADRRKLTRADFDAMVREILEDTFALFSLSPFRRAIARGTGERAPPVARLEFLRSRIGELEQVVTRISHFPRRRLAATETAVPYHQAKRATGREIVRSFQRSRILSETGTRSRLPPELSGRLPSTLRIRRRHDTEDLPEHREMAACLRSWRAWLLGAADQLGRAEAAGDLEMRATAQVWSRRCVVLARRIGALCELSPFADVPESPARLTLTSLFRNDPYYRRFYRLWQDLNLGIAAVFGDFLDLPLARTFELYELWCFLRLVRAAADEWGADDMAAASLFTSTPSGALTIASGAVTVPVGGGWKLCFQKSYREFWNEDDGRGSYSRIMTPDVVAWRDRDGQPGRLIVLDAKYRIDDGLNDALNSIHTYRDALVSEEAGRTTGIVGAAYLLSPQPPPLVGSYREAPMPGRLFHPDYRGAFRFGAVTLRPGMAPAELRKALRTVVADATGGE
jgi:hypothetical protein